MRRLRLELLQANRMSVDRSSFLLPFYVHFICAFAWVCTFVTVVSGVLEGLGLYISWYRFMRSAFLSSSCSIPTKCEVFLLRCFCGVLCPREEVNHRLVRSAAAAYFSRPPQLL